MEGRSMEYPTQQTQQTAPVHANTTTEIDLVEVFYLLWGHWWQILLSLIAGAAIAFAGTYFLITPQYQALTMRHLLTLMVVSLKCLLGMTMSGASLAVC